MTITEFIAKWHKVELKERSAAQEHFLYLCALFDHPSPATADPTGEKFCFEKGTSKQGGGGGFADVWKCGYFGWEYKGKHKDLTAAYNQLLRYRDALANPPLLVVCDLARIVIHTNFTGTVSVVHDIPLHDIGLPRNIEIIRALFHTPEALRPGRTSLAVTQDAAQRFGEIAESMRTRGHDSGAVAHFLDRIVFCLFAEDTGLLPDRVFTRMVQKSGHDRLRFSKLLAHLFDTMATGGDFGLETIRHFNGNLFDDRSTLEMTDAEIIHVTAAAELDWSAVDPSIFGTLFERGLDPAKRSQLGAHFTGMADIELVVDAVILSILRREWDECRTTIENLLATGKKKTPATPPTRPLDPPKLKKARSEAGVLLHSFLTHLQNVTILDPACGSGNFLYVALLRLKDLEKHAILYGEEKGLGVFLPMVGPQQLFGIEINPYAHDLAQMTVWIGWLQWIRVNGFGFPSDPILKPLSQNIRLMDAILAPDGSEPAWPKVDFIVGNPPFLGGSRLWSELGREYQEKLWALYKDRLPGASDLCCYWFEKARAHISAGNCKRAGLLATQAIRGGANREVLKNIKESGDIFWAESDRDWVLNGANVHVSMVGFDNGEETSRVLDGQPVRDIHANLSGAANTTTAKPLERTLGISFRGTQKGGDFNITEEYARGLLATPNPHGKPTSDILRPWLNGTAIVQRPANQWIIDCGTSMPLEEFRLYDAPHHHVLINVKPTRDFNKRDVRRLNWWLHAETAPAMRAAIVLLHRYLVTPRVSKYRIFTWSDSIILPDDGIYIFARSDDYFFGVLHSRFHEIWALAQGTQLEDRPRYTPTTCFETFPFPDENAPGFVEHRTAIETAARELNALREGWLNPPEWTRTEILEFPGTVGGPWHRYIDPATIESRGAFQVGTVRYPRLVARDEATAARLKNRTLTKLYNERPAWLNDCHARLDHAVAAAYNISPNLPKDDLLQHLLTLNLAS